MKLQDKGITSLGSGAGQAITATALKGLGLPLSTSLQLAEQAKLTPAQSAYIATMLAPGSGIADATGQFPEFPSSDVALVDAFSGEPMPSIAENIAAGGIDRYLFAPLQGLGALGDAAYGIPVAGAGIAGLLKTPAALASIASGIAKAGKSTKGIDAIPDQATKNFSDAMKSKNLMFIHNTSEEAIRSFDAMGGLPSPSLAVTESEIPLKNFGKIQLIGKPEKFDPAIDPRNKVYSADAYTPRAPKKLRLAKDGAESKLTKEYGSLAKEYGELDQLEQGQYALRNLQKDNMYYPENRLDELDRFFNSALGKLKYLKDQGFDLPTFKSAAFDIRLGMTKDFNKWAKKEKNKYLSQDGVLQYFDDFEETMVPKPYTLENAVNSMIKETQRGGEGFAGGYSPARMKALMSREYKDLSDIKSERGRLTDFPPSAMDLGDQIDNLLDAEYGFKVSFDPNAKYSTYNTSIGSNILNNIGIAIEDGKKFNEALLRNAYAEAIQNIGITSRNPFEPPKGLIKDLEDLFIKNATRNVEYFEAKPIRAVGFDEFAGAIVPKDTSQDVIDILQKRGLKVIKQTDADSTEDFFKTGARKQHFQDQMFSFAPVVGAGGIAALSIDKNTEDEDAGLGSL